jgi:hypothetical protein
MDRVDGWHSRLGIPADLNPSPANKLSRPSLISKKNNHSNGDEHRRTFYWRSALDEDENYVYAMAL